MRVGESVGRGLRSVLDGNEDGVLRLMEVAGGGEIIGWAAPGSGGLP